VHVHAGETALAARFFAGPPMLVSYCGDDILGDPADDASIPFVSRVRAAVIRGHAALTTATITKSQEMHNRLPRHIQRKNIVLPNGVDSTLFVQYDKREARQKLGWGSEERVVLFAATKPDIPRKRRWLAEEACALASEKLGPIRFHVSGLTPPDEMPVLMSAADCLLHTASLEGSPNVVKEALMCNLPVIATPSGDISLLLRGVEPSYICPPSPRALANALVELLAAPSASNGRASIENELSATAIAERLLALYSQLARPRWPSRVATVAEQRMT
jgi:teichuronic acid biosynthesis glycosyltransferase TuaC